MDGSHLLAAAGTGHDVTANEIRGELVDFIGDDLAELLEGNRVRYLGCDDREAVVSDNDLWLAHRIFVQGVISQSRLIAMARWIIASETSRRLS